MICDEVGLLFLAPIVSQVYSIGLFPRRFFWQKYNEADNSHGPRSMFLLNYSNTIDPILRDIRSQMPRFAGMNQGARVLDVCCGTGDQVFQYARLGISATGIDGNPDMIMAAERRRAEHRLLDAQFHVANSTYLPFENSYFDFASVCLALHEQSDEEQDETTSEMKRVVKKGGVLVFADFTVPVPRNLVSLAIRGVEFIAGKDNYSQFKGYIQRGGLPEILRRNCLTPDGQESIFLRGTVTMLRAMNI